MQRAAMTAAGTTLLSGTAACGQDVSSVPCLATVSAPTPVAGMTYVRASQIGCALDCNLSTGKNIHNGGPATDDGPKINAAMAGATAANPITLIIDGGALISGLFLPAGGYWSIAGLGCGTGFFVATGTNNDGIHNGGPQIIPTDPGPPAPARGSNVSLSNFTLNGNQGNGTTGDSTGGSAQGTTSWFFGISLLNLNNITITNVVVVNAPTYHIRLSNVGNVTISGCVLSSNGPNTDGIHFNGPANDIAIANCNITAGDDGIALNCPEGYTGNIERVTITDCTFNSWTMVRLYAQVQNDSPPYRINTVSVSGCTGVLSRSGFLVGRGAGGPPQAIDGVTISNCTMQAPNVLDLAINFGTISLSGVVLTPMFGVDAGYAFARTNNYDGTCTYAGTSLSMEDCSIVRQSDVAVAALILNYGSSIATLEFNGFSVKDPPGSTYQNAPALLNIVSGTLGQVVLASIDSTHVPAPVSAGGFASIGSISGAGVLATGWAFPDSVMANGTPYLSASTGQPSIKVGGVVEPYP